MKNKKNILFIVPRLPVHINSGDRVRVYYFVKKLADRGHTVDIIGFSRTKNETVHTDIDTICRQFIKIEKPNIDYENPNRLKQLKLFFQSFFKHYPYRVWQWRDSKFLAEAQRLLDQNSYDVVHFFETMMGGAFTELKKKSPVTKFVFDLCDSEAMSLNSKLKQNASLLSPFRFIEQFRLKKFEQQVVRRADETIFISERDKQYVGLDSASIVPNGVTFPEFDHLSRDIDLLFTGDMSAEVNIDATKWFVREVMPPLKEMNADINFYIVGANPSEEIKKLEDQYITVTGFVEELAPYYQRAKLFVCPLLTGAGQKNKVMQAMANQAPVISTPEGNMGIDARDDAIAIASDAENFVFHIKKLLDDENQRTKQAEKGYQFIKENFQWDKAVNLLEGCYEN